MKNYYKCAVCGNIMSLDTSMVLTSYPPKYKCWCDKCNHVNYINCSNINNYRWKRIKEDYCENLSEGDKANVIKTGQLTINGPKTFLENVDLSCLHIDAKIVGNPAVMTIHDDEQFLSIDQQIDIYEKALAELKAQKEKEKWQFTEDEKVILRNLPEKYNWLIRGQGGDLFIFTSEPQKIDYYWETVNKGKDPYCEIISTFNHLFKCIQCSDTEPCEFRKFI